MQLVCSLNQQARLLLWKIGALAAFVCMVGAGNALTAPLYPASVERRSDLEQILQSGRTDLSFADRENADAPEAPKNSRVLARMSEPGSRGEFQGARDASSDSANISNSETATSSDPGGVADDSGMKWDSSAPNAYGSWTSYGYNGATQSGGSEGQWYSVPGGDTYTANLLAGDKGKQDPSGSHWPGLADGPGCINLLDPVPEPSSLVFLLGAIFLAALLLVRSPMLR